MSNFQPCTKILATLGPASQTESELMALAEAGATGFRLNFSHGEPDWHRRCAKHIRSVAQQLRRVLPIFADIQGPKIRISTFAHGPVLLKQGQTFTLDLDCPSGLGGPERVGLDYEALPHEVRPNEHLLLDDGKIALEVLSVSPRHVRCRVVTPGPLSDHKGLSKRGGGLSAAPALTAKDRRDLKIACELEAEFLCVSFAKSAEDLHLARQLLREQGSDARIVAKVERAEVFASEQSLAELVEAADAVMVARGDLAIEIGDAALAAAQKQLIHCAKSLGKPVITATQMMESMIHSPRPTRAEILDLSNAILDGTDAILFSAETAAGEYPVETVRKAREISEGVETSWLCAPQALRAASERLQNDRPGHPPPPLYDLERFTARIASQMVTLEKDLKACVLLTATAQSALYFSSYNRRTDLAVVAASPSHRALAQAVLGRGVVPLHVDPGEWKDSTAVENRILNELAQLGLVRSGERLLLLRGDLPFISGGSNTCRVLSLP